MYFELSQEGAACSGSKASWPYRPRSLEEKIALAAELSRYDPRLLGILVEFFLKHWRKISAQTLRHFYPQMDTPQTLGVITEFCRHASPDKELHYFMIYLQQGLKKVPFQFYFQNIYTPGGKLAKAAAERSLSEYKRWGFFAREAPTIDVHRKTTVGRWDRNTRLVFLKKLFEKKTTLRVSDYQRALERPLSRQQALKDLQSIAQLKKGTGGRGALWVWRS